jgi:NAD+ synthase
LEVRDLTPLAEAFFAGQGAVTETRRRDRIVREGVGLLQDLAQVQGAFVLGSRDKTERLLGLRTEEDDPVFALRPLEDLYRTQVRELARAALNLPADVLEAERSPNLPDLDLSAVELDGYLFQMADVKLSLTRLLEMGVAEDKLRRIYRLLKEAARRRQTPPEASAQAVYAARAWNSGASELKPRAE